MKNKYFLLIISLFFTSLFVLGQAPQKIDFQAMARDASSNPITMQTIGVRISVIEGGSTVYTERHTPQTDDYGLFNIHIGDGTPLSGNFNNIDWGLGNHAVKVEVDPNGGYVYVNMGTSQLTSTPYSLYGEDDDADPNNELQTLSLVGNDLTISDGNTVTLPGGGGSSLWTQNGDDIYYDAGKVGIGIDTPEKEFHLFKGPGAGGGGYASTINAIIEDDFNAYLEFNGSSWAGITFNAQNASIHAGYFYNYANDRLMLRSGGEDNRMVIDADGKIGIGLAAPSGSFHVAKSISLADGVFGEDIGYPSVVDISIGNTTDDAFLYVGQSAVNKGFLAWSYDPTPQDAYFALGAYGGGNALVLQPVGGNVGINETEPEAKLDVNGTVKIGSAGTVFGEIKEITGTTDASNNWENIALPSGYNLDNTRVLSLEIQYLGDRWVGAGFGTNRSDWQDNIVSYNIIGSEIYIYYPNSNNFKNRAVRILLMKIGAAKEVKNHSSNSETSGFGGEK
jgi:hypothetical protein